jgi:hypothetical protein
MVHSGLYGVYPYGCVRLTVAMLATISFAALIFEDDDLFALALLDDVSFDDSTFNDRLSDLHILTVREHQYLIKSNLSSNVADQFFNAQNVALLNFILLASSGYDSIHGVSSRLTQTLKKQNNQVFYRFCQEKCDGRTHFPLNFLGNLFSYLFS